MTGCGCDNPDCSHTSHHASCTEYWPCGCRKHGEREHTHRYVATNLPAGNPVHISVDYARRHDVDSRGNCSNCGRYECPRYGCTWRDGW